MYMRLLILFFSITLLSLSSFAEQFCSEHGGNSALIVIDMQPGFVTRGGADQVPENKVKVNAILKEQVAAIKNAREAGIPIVFIEYEGFDPTNTVLKDAAKGYKNSSLFKKTSDGMFDEDNDFRKELIDHLKKHQIGTLIITGANGGACVKSSIRGSLKGNCNVVAYNKGIADFNYQEFLYPYAGHYKDIKPNCENCTFRETYLIESVADSMVKSKSGRY
jgi:nicotinamidase-related amidase